MHLLVETAMGDSEHYNILSPEELEAVKKEEQQLERRIEAGKRRLFLESRVENTARLLRKLANKGRMENGISLSPEHVKKPSSLPDTHDSGVEEGVEADEEVPGSFGSLAQEVWRLEQRKTELRNMRLEHTAGVLQKNNELRAIRGQGDGIDDDLDFEDDIHDSTLSSPRQSLSHLSQLLDGTLEALGNFGDQRERLRSINQSLFEYIQSVDLHVLRPPPADGGSSTLDIAYLEEAIAALRSHVQRVHASSVGAENSVKQYEVEYQQTNIMLAELWDAVAQADDNMKRNSYILRQAFPGDDHQALAFDEEPINDDDIPDAQAIIGRVHRLCKQAESLSQRLLAAKDAFAQERHLHSQARSRHERERNELTEQIQLINDKHMDSQKALADTETKLAHNSNRVQDMQNMMEANAKQLMADHEDAISNERSAHQEMKQTLLSQVLERQAAIDEAHSKLATYESEASNLHSAQNTTHEKMRDLTARLEELTMAFETAQKNVDLHQASAAAYSKQLVEMESSKRETDEQYRSLQTEHEEVAAHIGTITQKAADHEATASSLTQKLDQAKREQLILQQQVVEHASQLTVVHGQTKQHESTIANHIHHIEQLLYEHQMLQAEHDKLKTSHSQLGIQLEASENRALEHEAAAQDGVGELARLGAHIKQLQQQHLDVQNELAQAREFAISKDVLIAQHTKEAAELATHKLALETETARLQSELHAHNALRQEHQGLRDRFDALTDELESMRHHAGNDTQRNAKLESQIATHVAEKSGNETRIETLQKERADLVQDYETLVREELEVEKEREAMESSIDELKQRVESLETTLSEERIRAMGKRQSMLSERDANEGMTSKVARAGAGTTMSVMRNEFKKMMREARAEHFRSLKVGGFASYYFRSC
jgi:chromosome segregation ATPase